MEPEPIITRMRELLREHYIFPDVTAELDRLLAGRAYDGGDLPAFAAAVTADLQSVNGDPHLRLLYHEEELVDAPTDGERERATMAAWADRTAGGMARVARLPGNVGYLEIQPVLFPPVLAGDRAVAALTLLADCDALIIDVRGCRGGTPAMVALICGYLFGDEPVHLIDMHHGDGTVQQSWTAPYVPGRRYGPDKPIFVVTGGRTFSGGEELAYDLQQLGRATLVGERTRGGAHPREGFRVHPHLEATIPVARSAQPVTGGNWEGTGVVPDVEVKADEAPVEAYRLALARMEADEAAAALADLDRDGTMPW